MKEFSNIFFNEFLDGNLSTFSPSRPFLFTSSITPKPIRGLDMFLHEFDSVSFSSVKVQAGLPIGVRRPPLKDQQRKERIRQRRRQRSARLYVKKKRTRTHVGLKLERALAHFKKLSVSLVSIRVTQNNIFCTLTNLVTQKVVYALSAGRSKLHTSKKSLKYCFHTLLPIFLKRITFPVKGSVALVNFTVTRRLRRFTLFKLTEPFRWVSCYLFFNGKKCFNGCRPPKQRRKKHKKYRIFK